MWFVAEAAEHAVVGDEPWIGDIQTMYSNCRPVFPSAVAPNQNRKQWLGQAT
jgi:hypothetical protein